MGRHHVVTYNIENAEDRPSFVEDFENVLESEPFKFEKQSTNQTTYYGFYEGNDFHWDLFYVIKDLNWDSGDTVTIYSPRTTREDGESFPDIGRFSLKNEGSTGLNMPPL